MKSFFELIYWDYSKSDCLSFFVAILTKIKLIKNIIKFLFPFFDFADLKIVEDI